MSLFEVKPPHTSLKGGATLGQSLVHWQNISNNDVRSCAKRESKLDMTRE